MLHCEDQRRVTVFRLLVQIRLKDAQTLNRFAMPEMSCEHQGRHALVVFEVQTGSGSQQNVDTFSVALG